MIFNEFRLKNIDDLMTFVYKNPALNLPLFAKVCDEAAKANDGIASQILHETGQEIASSVLAAAKQLGFSQDQKIPLVAVGGVFRSRLAYYSFEVNLQKDERFDFAISKPQMPAIGAVKLALEAVK
jgi:N-acetylglucosamine kinase-like BadF-type ATPase